MRRFAALFARVDATTKTNAKVEAMASYFEDALAQDAGTVGDRAADAAWALFLLSGNRFKRLLAPSRLRVWAAEETGLPEWLFRESYAAVGDLAETTALLLAERGAHEPTDPRDPVDSDTPLHVWIEQRLLPLRGVDEDEARLRVVGWWRSLPADQVFLLAKILTGGLRVGVSQGLTVRALAQATGIDRAVLAHRLMGHWEPSAEAFHALCDPEERGEHLSRPYPFFLASPLDGEPSALGPVDDWLAEWKWDGIRGQLLRRGGAVYLWSRGEELVTERFPEVAEAALALPDGTALDGEVLAWRDGAPLPFALLQKRIGRKKPGAKSLRDAPVAFLAYDLLEEGGDDLRERPLVERRARLEALLAPTLLDTSPRLDAASWEALAGLRREARARGVEGLMLKRRDAPYRVGRRRGDWWKWKLDPLTVDAVMIYAQAGHGRRASLFTDYTFGVWRGDELVPIAKAYSGLDDAEIRRLDHWIRRNTRERFGPVRSVEPVHVFELGFENIRRSTRHKSGLAVRFPRILRWREDLTPRDADTLDDVVALLETHESETQGESNPVRADGARRESPPRAPSGDRVFSES
ncbi:MAG: ATP-dependent DNA ligase [Acidobacteriota bacterium]